jgi:ferricrocin synthase
MERGNLSLNLVRSLTFGVDIAGAVYQLLSQVVSHIFEFPFSAPLSLREFPDSLAQELKQIMTRSKTNGEDFSRSSFEPNGVEAPEAWSEVETAIRSVLAELSGNLEGKINRHTSIFQLGLDSINAVQISSVLRQRGLQVSAVDVIECRTCAAIGARFLEKKEVGLEKPKEHDLAPFQAAISPMLSQYDVHLNSVSRVLPCTPVQGAMLTEFIQSGGRNYFNHIQLSFEQDISSEDVDQALRVVIDKYEMLRTGFIEVDHSDAQFTMIQYATYSAFRLISAIKSTANRSFNINKWKLDTAQNALQHLANPPWAAAIVSESACTSLHLGLHHAIYDAQSLQFMLQDLSRALQGQRLPGHPRLDRAIATILGLAKDESKSKKYWESWADRVVVNRFPIMTPLTVYHRQLEVQSKTSKLSFKRIQERVTLVNLSVQAVIQVAWTRILSSYVGESSVVFGIVLSGRTVEETKDAPFPCLTTVPVIATNRESNWDMAQHMMEYNALLYKHQFSPLSRIQSWVGKANIRLFDSLVVYQRLHGTSNGRVPWRIVQENAGIDYPVSLEIDPATDGHLHLRISSYSDILPKEQAQLLLEQFDEVFSHVVEHPKGDANDLWQVAPGLFSILPPPIKELPATERLLHEIVELKALSHPSKVALEFVDGFDENNVTSRMWTYQELNTLGNKVARLVAKYAKPGCMVALHMGKCPEAYFTILGILKAGCAFLALDPAAPSSRKEFIIKDCGAKLLLTELEVEGAFAFNICVPKVNVSLFTLSNFSGEPFSLNDFDKTECAYCLYTSGTTGTPKGCEISHENVVQAMMAFQCLFEGHWTETSRWLQFASFHFDVSVLEQYWSWSVGITVVAASRDLILDDLAESIRRLGITHIDLTPSLARLLHPDEVPSLCDGVFITGGEQLRQEILEVWGPKAVIYNAYGPTEATIGVTMYQQVPKTGRSSNIGQQFPNVGAYVLKPGTEVPVLRGGIGELCISGKLVGRGYLNRPELTAECFPTLTTFEERVYRTGDLVRLLYDGCFEFIGRADDQVKLRGQRLEIGEINNAIRSHVPQITDVITILTKQKGGHKALLASFVVCASQTRRRGDLQISTDNDARLTCQAAQEACRFTLPGYMVPTYVFQLPFIPLSPNNKADTKELKRIFEGITQDRLLNLYSPLDGESPPLSQECELDTSLVLALQDFTGEDKMSISPRSSIFDLGVDSISVLRLARKIKSRGLLGVTPSLILRHPVLADLARVLRIAVSLSDQDAVREAKQRIQACSHKNRLSVTRELVLSDNNIEYVAPCTPLQQGMISRFMTRTDESVYFNTVCLDIHGGVSRSKLRTAWESVYDSLAILRTQFLPTIDGFVQVAVKSSALPWQELTSSGAAVSWRDQLAKLRADWITENSTLITRPFSLSLCETEDELILVINIFHGLYDGRSLDLILKLAVDAYHSDIGRRITAPPFSDVLPYGPLQKFDHCQPFWIKHLEGWSFTPIPSYLDVGRSPETSHSRSMTMTHILAAQKELNVTLQAIILALWVQTLRQYTYLNQVTIGMLFSGRSMDVTGIQDIEGIIGPMFNCLPFHYQSLDSKTWTDVIRECHDFCAAVLPFQHVPLRDIQKWCSRGQALFDNIFSFQMQSVDSRPSEFQAPWRIMDGYAAADYPIAFEAVVTPSGALRATVVAQTKFSDETILDILSQFESNAVQISEKLNSPFDDSSMHHSRVTTPSDTIQGQPLTQTPVNPSFEWTQAALLLRAEIASLAGIPEGAITENTSLFELGLDSIDIARLATMIKRRHLSITSSQMMHAQTISGMVKKLKQTNGLPNGQEQPKAAFDSLCSGLKEWIATADIDIDRELVEDVWPPTALQESMLTEMLESDFTRYFNHDVLELPLDVDLSRLAMAWDEVVQHSPILRAAFFPLETPELSLSFCLVVLKHRPIRFDIYSLGSFDNMDDILRKSRTRAKELHGRGNLLQLAVMNIGKRSYLILSLAHALYDGWSLSLLHQDVIAAYYGKFSRRPSPRLFLANAPMPGAEPDDSQKFWKHYLAGAHPTIVGRDNSKMRQENTVHFEEAASNLTPDAVQEFCKKQSISLQAVGQACWAVVLATMKESLDINFGTVLSGRESAEAQDVMFPTMNTVVVRCIMHGTGLSLLRYVQDNINEIYQYQQVPLRQILSLAGKGPRGLFDTLFILQRAPPSNTTMTGDGPFMKSIQSSSAVEYPICVEMEQRANEISWAVACDTGILSIDEASLLLHRLDHTLSFFVNQSTRNALSFADGQVSVCGLPSFQQHEEVDDKPDVDREVNCDRASPWNNTEKTIRRALADISGVSESYILKSHNVYHLGLDSISAIKVVAKLRKVGVSMTVRDLVSSSSIQEMGRKLRDLTKASQLPDSIRKVPSAINVQQLLSETGYNKTIVEMILPATPMQVCMLATWHNSGGLVFYPEFKYRINCPGIDMAKALQAWEKVVATTAILRTCFVATGDEAVPFLQIVLRIGSHRTADCSGPDADQTSSGIMKQPLVKISFDIMGDNVIGVKLRIHHALYDGVSLPHILNRLTHSLGEEMIDDSHALERWQQLVSAHQDPLTILSRERFWKTYLGTRVERTLLTVKQHSVDDTPSKRLAHLERSACQSISVLVSLCQQRGLSFQALFFAAYAKAVVRTMSTRISKEGKAIVFGVYLANRALIEGLENIPFPTLNLLPLKVIIGHDMNLWQTAGEIQSDLHEISAMPNATAGLWEIKKWTGTEINSFVNFLTLPDSPSTLTPGIFVEEITSISAGDDLTNGAVKVAPEMDWMAANAIRDAYPVSTGCHFAVQLLKAHDAEV